MNYCFTMQKECKWCGAMGQCTATSVCSEQSNILYSNKTLVVPARGNGKTLMSLAKQLSITYDIPFEKALEIVYESKFTVDGFAGLHDEVIKPMTFYEEYEQPMYGYYETYYSPLNVIAWMPYPEPYNPAEEES